MDGPDAVDWVVDGANAGVGAVDVDVIVSFVGADSFIVIVVAAVVDDDVYVFGPFAFL